jgi:hypothetical protein
MENAFRGPLAPGYCDGVSLTVRERVVFQRRQCIVPVFPVFPEQRDRNNYIQSVARNPRAGGKSATGRFPENRNRCICTSSILL